MNINWGAASGFLRYSDSAGEDWQTHFRYRDTVGAGTAVDVLEVGRTSELGEPLYSAEGRADPSRV